jgi:hypothetical protein
LHNLNKQDDFPFYLKLSILSEGYVIFFCVCVWFGYESERQTSNPKSELWFVFEMIKWFCR